MQYDYLISVFLIHILLYFLFKKRFLKSVIKFKLVDRPGKNKLHKKNVPVTGGIIIFISLILYLFSNYFLPYFEKDMIDRYQKTLKGVFERLGSRQSVNEQTIRSDMDTYYNQNLGDLNNVIDRVNSQGYANQRSRGMLDSSVEDDRKRELTNKYAGLMSTARTDAQDRAFKKASDYETLVSTNRSNIMGEYDNLYTQPFNMMNTARKSDGQGALTGAGNVASSVAASAQANATNTANAFGRELENLRENDWNFDYKYKPEKDKE